MILIDFEGEILLDIAEEAMSTKTKAGRMINHLSRLGWSPGQIRLAFERVITIKTNAHEEGRQLPKGLK